MKISSLFKHWLREALEDMAIKEEVNILVPLDVFLDTRIATVARLDAQKATELLMHGYHERRSDFYPGIDKKAFDALYESRDLKTLLYAQCTNIFIILRDLLASLVYTSSTTPYFKKISVLVNLTPYEIIEPELTLILKAIGAWLTPMAEISAIRLSDKELTPQYVKEHFNVLFRYEYSDWLEMHTEDFEHSPIPEVDLYVPAISFTHDLTDSLLKELKSKRGTHPIDDLKFAMAPFINLQPLDVSAFSVYAPEKLFDFNKEHK